MRPIDPAGISRRLPPGWEAKAEEALAAVRAVADDQKKKSEVLTRYADVWRALKPILSELSYNKCWYCESHDIRSDGVVEHFRPKARVAGVKSHPGYWWLAFDPTNFRYCCTYCNSRRLDAATGKSGGKQDQFPLFDESARAYPEESIDKEKEAIVLLDPVVAGDTLLLYFGEDGEVGPRFPAAASKLLTRVEASIDIYHLNHTDLIEARLELLNRIRTSVELGKAYYSAWQHGDKDAMPGFHTAVTFLKQLVTDRAEFTYAARDMIKGLREEGHPWIDAIV